MKPPVATYRLQLNRHLTFQDVIARLDYLRALNISHLYLSPIMEAVAGSEHGYDVTDFAAVSRERGGEEGLRALDRRLRETSPKMHLILDIVPNHMAAGLENRYWRDMLARGANSAYWRYFDLRIDAGGKIEIPRLWDDQGVLVASGDIAIELDDADPVVRCGQTRYPVNSATEALLRARFRSSGQKSFGEYLSQLPPAAVSDILNAQHYAFILSTQASHTSSYRRFFDVNGLVAMRMEDETVYQETHQKLFDLIHELPSIAGVRVDHVDGLAMPGKYLKWLSQKVPGIWVEKILARHEEMRDWPCLGTTGYEFIDRLNMVMTDARGFRRIETGWKEARPKWKDFSACVRKSKLEVLDTLFPAEVQRLATFLHGSRYDAAALKGAVAGMTAALSVYRVYGSSAYEDKKWLGKAAATLTAKRSSDETKLVIDCVTSPSGAKQRRFFGEWQRLTGPAMAKGLEDRAHYRYTPLAALNEVGCAPVIADNARKDFCKWLRQRLSSTPLALNAATTHDTKKSEGVRHRLQALADIPEAWENYVRRALRQARPSPRIDAATAQFFFQAVLGTWPLDDAPGDDYSERISRYMLKAAREAALETSWSWPDHAYESDLENFVRRTLANALFLRSTATFMRRVAAAGAVNSLAELAIRTLSAGVPDIYQGTEVWNFTLVDPDNRATVDFDTLEAMMRRCEGEKRKELIARLMTDWRSGEIKMWLLRELLKIRRGFLRAAEGDYDIRYLDISGDKADNVIAYHLRARERQLAVVAARHPGRLVRPRSGIDVGGADWADTAVHLPRDARAADLLSGANFPSGGLIAAGELLRHLPVAVLAL